MGSLKPATAYKHMVLVAFVLVSLAIGCLAQILRHKVPPGTVDLSGAVIQALLVFIWYQADAEERHFSRSVLLNIGIVGFSVIALPYHFFRTRKFRSGLLATFLAVLIAASSWGAQYAGAWATYKLLHR